MGLIGAIPSRKCSILRHLQNEEITQGVMLPEALEHFVLLKTQTWPICFEDSSSRVGLTKNRYKTSFFSFSYLRNFFIKNISLYILYFAKILRLCHIIFFIKCPMGKKPFTASKLQYILLFLQRARPHGKGKYYKYSKK